LRFDPPFLKRGLIRQVQTHDYEGTVDGDPNSSTTGQGHPGDRQADGVLPEHGAQISPRWPGRAAAGIARETGKQTRSVQSVHQWTDQGGQTGQVASQCAPAGDRCNGLHGARTHSSGIYCQAVPKATRGADCPL